MSKLKALRKFHFMITNFREFYRSDLKVKITFYNSTRCELLLSNVHLSFHCRIPPQTWYNRIMCMVGKYWSIAFRISSTDPKYNI